MNNLLGYKELEHKIGYQFKNPDLCVQALSHSSYINEKLINKSDDYERLEFLGDAVLELCVSEHLYKLYPDSREGDMTKLRASLVCEPTLANIAVSELGLGEYLLLSKGEEGTGGRERDSIISDVFEAIIGAIYLDGGFIKAQEYIQRFVLSDMQSKIDFMDSKTKLYEYAQNLSKVIRYDCEEMGPPHNRTYKVDLYIDDAYISSGSGKTKKAAQQNAARDALKKL